MDEQLLSWCAGFFEGEGHVALQRKGRDCYTVRLHIGNTEPDLLTPFTELFGGHIYVETKPHPRQPLYRWTAYGGTAIRVIEILVPYVVGERKKELCDIIRRFAELRYQCLRCGKPLEIGSYKWYCSKSCKWWVGRQRAKNPDFELPRAHLSPIFAELVYRSYELNGGREKPRQWDPPSRDPPGPSQRGKWIRASREETPDPQ